MTARENRREGSGNRLPNEATIIAAAEEYGFGKLHVLVNCGGSKAIMFISESDRVRLRSGGHRSRPQTRQVAQAHERDSNRQVLHQRRRKRYIVRWEQLSIPTLDLPDRVPFSQRSTSIQLCTQRGSRNHQYRIGTCLCSSQVSAHQPLPLSRSGQPHHIELWVCLFSGRQSKQWRRPRLSEVESSARVLDREPRQGVRRSARQYCSSRHIPGLCRHATE